MQALAIGGDLLLRSSVSGQSMPWPGPRLDTPIRMVIVWMVGPALAVQLSLQPAHLPVRFFQRVAEQRQPGLLFSHHRHRGRAHIQSHFAGPQRVPGFPQRLAPDPPAQQPDIFHPGLSSVRMHFVVFVDQGFQPQSLPLYLAVFSPADARIIVLAFLRRWLEFTDIQARARPFLRQILQLAAMQTKGRIEVEGRLLREFGDE